MRTVTYQAEELNLLPAVKNAQVVFNGDLDLNARPDGAWTIEGVWIDVATPGPRFSTIHTMHKLLAGDVLHTMIVKAAEAHDRTTGAISDFVRDELEAAAKADADDRRWQEHRDAKAGVGVEAR